MVLERKLVQIPVSRLAIGMYVAELDRPWTETPFLFQGFQIRNVRDLMQLREYCRWVKIDVVRSAPELHAEILPKALNHPRYDQVKYSIAHEFEHEIHRADSDYRDMKADLKSMLDQIREHKTVNLEVVQDELDDCIRSIERNPSAMLWLSRIKHRDDYAAEHALNVAVLAVGLGRHLGLKRTQLEFLALCGILHDIGTLLVDEKILHKPSQLTDEEFEEIRKHTLLAEEILESDTSLPREVRLAALCHHERIDGAGYPRKLLGPQISFYAKVTAIADVYDAMTSERPWRKAMPPSEALRYVYENRGTQFDEELVVKFIEFIGLYPPGCVVQMASGEIGVVLSADPKRRLHPRVALIRDAAGNPLEPHIVDLRQRDGDVVYSIKRTLGDGEFGIDLETLTPLLSEQGEQKSPPNGGKS